jgi:putative transposase
MPRQARLDAPEALHHVMVRGLERRTIFPEMGTGHLLARNGLILREADFTFGRYTNVQSHAHERPECELHGMPRRRRRFQVSPT